MNLRHLLKKASWPTILIHSIFWAIYGFAILSFYRGPNPPDAEDPGNIRFYIMGGRILADLFIFYLTYLWAIPKLLGQRRIGWFVVYAFLMIVGFTIARWTYDAMLMPTDAKFYIINPQLPSFAQFFTRAFSSLFAFIMAGAGRFTFDWFLAQKERQVLEKERLSSELAFLKSQVNPHFLFNTLNNIYGLARKQNPATEDAILKLSGLMRYMLYETNAPEVPLARELQQLEDYLSLQALRYSRTEVATLHTSGQMEQHQIAPLLLIPLVENGFKHGRFSQPDDHLDMYLEVNEEALTFTATNPIAPRTETRDAVGGVGLENIRRRLELLYPNRHALSIAEEKGYFTATLTIQWA